MQPLVYEQLGGTDTIADDSEMSPLSLSVADLSSILKWSKEISSDINLAAGRCFGYSCGYPFTIFLQLYNALLRFQPVGLLPGAYLLRSELSLEICAPEKVCLVIAREAGDYSIATTMEPPGACHVHV